MLEGGGCRAEGGKREKKKWDNCNSIINKIHILKKKKKKPLFSENTTLLS